MDKKAGVINKSFAVMDAVDGAKRVKSAYQNSANNRFDITMGTPIKKGVNNGNNNAQIAGMNKVSCQLDSLYKQASLGSIKVKVLRKIVSADAKNTKHLKDMVSGIRNRQVNKAFSSGVKAAKVTVPATAGMIGTGVATAKGLKKIDEKVTKSEVQPDRALEYNTIGAGVTAGLALGALAKGKVIAPYHAAGKAANTALIKMPMKAVRNSKAGKIVADTLKNSANAMNSANKQVMMRNRKAANTLARQAQQKEQEIVGIGKDLYNMMNNNRNAINESQALDIVLKKRKSNFIANSVARGIPTAEAEKAWNAELNRITPLADQAIKNLKNSTKKASESLDVLEKVAGAKSDYFKMVFKDHFIKEGLKSIPYYAAPAALSMALSTDLRHGMKKIDKEDDNVLKAKDATLKTAAFKIPSGSSMPKLNTPFAKEMFEKGVDGVARTVFPATVMTLTGRNITNAFEKIDSENRNRNMQEGMANRIIIQINGDDTKRKIKRDVSKQLDSVLSKQASDTPEKQILQNIKKEIEEHTGKNVSVDAGKIKIGLGVKKQFRMKQ